MNALCFESTDSGLQALDESSLVAIDGGNFWYDAAYVIGATAHAVWNEVNAYANSDYGKTAAMWM